MITDVSEPASVNALASRTLDHFGRVDIVVNNAGITDKSSRPLWQTEPQDWQRVLGMNLLGVVHGIQAFVPHLVNAGTGHVVNTASVVGLMTMPFVGAYCASKHAVVAISEMLHHELETMGLPIGVTVACPGLVRTPLVERVITSTQSDDAWAEHLPADVPPELARQRRAAAQGLVATLMEPEAAAKRILDAGQADRFYALTHGDINDGARRRVESILAAVADLCVTAPMG